MSIEVPPLLAVRLIGPTETVAIQKNYLTAFYSEFYGDQVAIRTSTRSARRTGFVRMYLTITSKETHGQNDTGGSPLGDRPGR